MRLRTFIADTMADAVEQVRAAMGDNAIIVSSLEGENGGFEVTAALDSRAPSLEKDDTDLTLEEILRGRLGGGAETPDTAADHPGERKTDTVDISDIHSGLPFDETSLADALDEHGVPRILAEAIITDAGNAETDDALAALCSALQTRFTFDPLPIAPRHPVMAVGLPGAGKTVTIAKLAARAALDGAHTEIISTDAQRTGAAAQCEAYGSLLQMPFAHAETVDAMGLLLDQRTDRIAMEAGDRPEACFIDTGATNPFLGSEAKLLKRQIDAAQLVAATEPILILSAGGDPRGMSETANAFASLGVSRIIVTQIDIARRLGGALAAAEVAGLSFAQVSATPFLARGISSATALRFAQLILGKNIRAQGSPDRPEMAG